MIKNNNIIFTLTHLEKIIIKLDDSLELLCDFCTAPIFFITNQKKYLLSTDCIQYNMRCFVKILKKALDCDLKLHESIQKNNSIVSDIGYLYNEDLQNQSDLTIVKEPEEEYELWIGYKYGIWGDNIKTWIYNDKKGNIIFKLTPIFPGKFSTGKLDPNDPEEMANFLWYKEWIKSYKPILTRKIPKKIALQWLEQAEDIVKQIDHNIQQINTPKESSSSS
jgi:hypothetical protein